MYEKFAELLVKNNKTAYAVSKETGMKHLCPACFTELPEKANYCPACGKCMKYPVELPGIIGRKISPYIRAVAIADRAIHIED